MTKRRHKRPIVALVLYIIEIIILMVEAAIPGDKSAQQSNAVGNTLADFFNDVEGDQTVAITPDSLSILNKIDKGFVGEEYQLIYETLPEDSTYKSTVFSSSNKNVATINEDGVISFLNIGTVTISAINEHYPSICDSFTLTVYNIEATSISSSILNATINEDIYTLYLGKEYVLHTLFTPENTTIKNVEYSFNEKYLKVSDDGVITPLTYTANKNIELKVIHYNLESTLKIKIDYENIVNLASLDLNLENNSICVKQSITPSVTITPSNATFNTYTLTSSDPSIAKINKNKIIGVKEGKVNIICTSTVFSDIFDVVEIEVLPQPELLDFSIVTKSIFVNEEVSLKYKLVPEYAKTPSNISFESLDSSIVTVTNEGIIKGVSIGRVKIKTTFNNIVKTFEIDVKTDQIIGNENFDVNVKNDFLNYGQEYLISDILEITNWYPEVPRDTTISYSLENESYGEIKEKTITLTNLGENLLFITHNYTNITKIINLNCVGYNYLAVDKDNNPLTNIDLKVNETLSFKISDTQNLNNIHQTYEISSSNDKIISVSKNNNEYLIKALDEGHSVINVKSFIDGENINNVSIKVSSRHVYTSNIIIHLFNDDNNEEIIPNENNFNVFINGYYSLSTQTSIDTTKEKIRFISSNPSVVTVNSNGNLLFHNIGTSEITILDELSNISKTIKLNVYNYIKLDSDNPFTITGQDLEVIDNLYYSMTNGFSGKINLNFDENSTFSKVNYTSSNEKVAVIGKDGTITPIKVGETIIKVTCDDGMQNKIEFEIKLKIKKQDYIKNVTDFIYKVRKGLGHFSAFLILGIISTFTWLLFFREKKLLFSIPLNYITGFIIACVTELIQVYVPGRCGLFDDVILDFNGFLVSSSILTVLIIIHQIRVYIKYKKQDI